MRQRVVTPCHSTVDVQYMYIGASLSSTKLATEMVFRAVDVWFG